MMTRMCLMCGTRTIPTDYSDNCLCFDSPRAFNKVITGHDLELQASRSVKYGRMIETFCVCFSPKPHTYAGSAYEFRPHDPS